MKPPTVEGLSNGVKVMLRRRPAMTKPAVSSSSLRLEKREAIVICWISVCDLWGLAIRLVGRGHSVRRTTRVNPSPEKVQHGTL